MGRVAAIARKLKLPRPRRRRSSVPPVPTKVRPQRLCTMTTELDCQTDGWEADEIRPSESMTIMKLQIEAQRVRISELEQRLRDERMVVHRAPDGGMCFSFGRRKRYQHTRWRCDRCDTSGEYPRSPSSERFGCDRCDFDLCRVCHAKIINSSSRHASKKRSRSPALSSPPKPHDQQVDSPTPAKKHHRDELSDKIKVGDGVRSSGARWKLSDKQIFTGKITGKRRHRGVMRCKVLWSDGATEQIPIEMVVPMLTNKLDN